MLSSKTDGEAQHGEPLLRVCNKNMSFDWLAELKQESNSCLALLQDEGWTQIYQPLEIMNEKNKNNPNYYFFVNLIISKLSHNLTKTLI